MADWKVSLSGNIIQGNTRYFTAQKKRCGGGGEKTSEALQKYLFVLCSKALKLFSNFEPLESVTCWQHFTRNVSFVWFETAEIITSKWKNYNIESNISMYCTSSTSLLMTSVEQFTQYLFFLLTKEVLSLYLFSTLASWKTLEEKKIIFFWGVYLLLWFLTWIENVPLALSSHLFWPSCYWKVWVLVNKDTVFKQMSLTVKKTR